MESQRISALVALDLSAAFDTVDCDILLEVLDKQFGIQGKALSWFDIYLRPRGYKVQIGERYSTVRNLPYCVAQGSSAGPILYSAYASTLQHVIEDIISLYGFADDHSIRKDFIAVKNDNHEERETILMLEKYLGKIKMWMDENRLKMNCSETELILFGSRQQRQKYVTTHINVNGDEVYRSNIIKYLGAWMDEQLTMKQHITNKCRLAMYNIQNIKLIRPMLTEDVTKTILLGTVISHLDYVKGILIGLPDTDYKKLQHVQNIAANW